MRSFIGALLACWSLSVLADPQALKAQLQDYYFDAARRGDGDAQHLYRVRLFPEYRR